MRNFDTWLAGFRPSIADYKYYVDFDKVFKNVEAVKIPLNILNSLIGSKNIEDEFRNILTEYPETLRCIPILLAKRELEIMAMDEEGQIDFHFDRPNCTNEDYVKFMRKTGLFDLMENHIVNNLVDYVTGIETGLGYLSLPVYRTSSAFIVLLQKQSNHTTVFAVRCLCLLAKTMKIPGENLCYHSIII